MLSEPILTNLTQLVHDESLRFVLLIGGLVLAILLTWIGTVIARLVELEDDVPPVAVGLLTPRALGIACRRLEESDGTSLTQQYQATAGDPRRC